MGNIAGVMGGGFRPSEHEAASDFEVLPPGWFVAQIDDAEVCETKLSKEAEDSSGFYLKLKFKIMQLNIKE